MKNIGGFLQRVTHPDSAAWKAEKEMNERFSKLPNYVEGASVLHHWERDTNTVQWIYSIPGGLSPADEAKLEQDMLDILAEY